MTTSQKSTQSAVAATADGSTLFSGADDKKVMVWQRKEDGKYHLLEALNNHKKMIRALAVSADGYLMLSGSNDTEAYKWRRQKKVMGQSIMTNVEIIQITLRK